MSTSKPGLLQLHLKIELIANNHSQPVSFFNWTYSDLLAANCHSLSRQSSQVATSAKSTTHPPIAFFPTSSHILIFCMPTENLPTSNQTSSDRRPAGPPLWMGFNLRMQPTVTIPYTYQGSPRKDSPSELLGEKTQARVVGQYGRSIVGDLALSQNTQTNSELGRGTVQSGDQSAMDDRLPLHANSLIPKYSRTTKYRWGCFRMASSNNVFGTSDHIRCSTAYHSLLYYPGDSCGDTPGCKPRHLGGLPTRITTAKTMERSWSKP